MSAHTSRTTGDRIAAIETYADDAGWHNRIAGAAVPLTRHDSREEAERLGAEMARQRGGGHRVLA
ncbi:uncharacterized protein DUF2188 [Rathayibacter sp. PhB93]|uniref:DUF2188 domain-containing protein n=1 Tax=unclassified Rathayibacter TaxID=2609250 RepID=UPI000F4ADB51|nr:MULTISPECIES: DUF2188 domain-containing protein [unclassified Rathayibacter]ROQ17018.1 uncharacterized protein DUF2188 [Rathayibacter sp. PhB93]ROS23346.1 uncharacterized protein DUF2188 [Rathayibacter sp. PhB127]TDQ06766.1 uncharacterized protein DUF2188 [Rathayibacter sp. PhB1]